MAITLVIVSVSLTANTEKAYKLPYGTKSLQVQCRTAVALLMATSQGAVDTSTAPGKYFTIKANSVFKENKLDIQNEDAWIYLAAASGVTAELVIIVDDSYNGGKNVT